MTPTLPDTSVVALGATITAGALFVGGALGALTRAFFSKTQKTWSERTAFDVLLGGVGSVILPRLPLVTSVVTNLDQWDLVQKFCLAFGLGLTGTWAWTVAAWRTGRIATAEQIATGVKPPPPEVGVLKGTPEATVAAEQFTKGV